MWLDTLNDVENVLMQPRHYHLFCDGMNSMNLVMVASSIKLPSWNNKIILINIQILGNDKGLIDKVASWNGSLDIYWC